ncbi:uncharacterized protein EV420DRAFT_1725943 [Desarmillaria tabescens]|uniref:Sister chromatid cohesion protein n=1 Tax=Armillaria tabescens TaxID=1929756 RepID=A0AA39T4T3_ARMTA|nr:uncharacterized protein EV420DRAFT_1725943 [Desarmillaria tabescens]KAK0464696.1 hypothetical protein EV420DRAFT_1725943 [Desarmillaria tabescens]
MDGREQWYRDGASQRATDSVHESHKLLAVYPMASATPSTHDIAGLTDSDIAARHLGNMTSVATPPSFVQPNYYSMQSTSYPQGNPPPYTEYASELTYLSSQNVSADDSGYWESTRNDAVRLMQEQAGPSYPYPNSTHWTPSGIPASTYPTSSLAQSVFQHTAPTAAYPTPPPPTIPTSSSSSLAFALGPPPTRHVPPPPKVYTPDQSQEFINDFLAKKTQEIKVREQAQRPSTPPRQRKLSTQESPDPLALKPVTPRMQLVTVTPSKRKPVVELVSSSVKRIHSKDSFHTPHRTSGTSLSSTPSSSRTSVPITPSTVSGQSTPKRTKTMAYVAMPRNPWATPSTSSKSATSRRLNDSPNDLGGFGSEDGPFSSPMRGTARGNREDRAPMEKLESLLEDIFEAEDALPADADLADLNMDFFSPATTDTSRPLLHPNIVRKLSKYIGQVARPNKRVRHGGPSVTGTPRNKGRLAEATIQSLSRILKLLERTVRTGENLDPFAYSGHTTQSSPRKASPKKPKARKPDRRSKSKTPVDGEREEDVDAIHADNPPNRSPTESDFENLGVQLEAAKDSVLAAECCITLLGSDRLPKQLYSEELITACLSTLKNQLNKVIYPFAEASSEAATTATNPLLLHVVKNSADSESKRKVLNETFQTLSASLSRINSLINAESVAMSDSIVIQAVYIAIGPFFVVEGDSDIKGKKDQNVVIRTFGKSAMHGLMLEALSLIRSIFASHEGQRSWIIEEILSSLIKLSDSKQKAGLFRLRDGRSIRTVSALLLQLVQTSAHDVRVQAKKIEKARQQKVALRRQESFTESQSQITREPFLDEHDSEEIRLYYSGLDSASKAAKAIIIFLTQRSGKGKTTKNTNEAEYRLIFDNLISDVLVVLYWPEWPAASLLLSVASKFMVAALDDVKTSQADNNAAKTMALDHLGVIAARIQHFQIVSSVDTKELEKLLSVHHDISTHLSKRSLEDQAYDASGILSVLNSAQELTAATLGHELAIALKHIDTLVGGDDDDELAISGRDSSKFEQFGQKIKVALRNVCKDQSRVYDVLMPSLNRSQEEISRIDRYAEEIGTIQGLRNSFQPILNIILTALDAPHIFMRTKALRALGQIVLSDATILSTPGVRRGIENHLLDSSPAVRDAAVELIGKYMVDRPEVAGDYYQKIAERIADTGLSVRKRVIKLLKSFYGVTRDSEQQTDIATRLVLRMLDEDDTVKELAIKTLEELWFPAIVPLPSALKSKSTNNVDDKSALLGKVSVIMAVSGHFKDRQSPLEEVLHKIMAGRQESEVPLLHSRYTEICEALIDGLVDASDLPGFSDVSQTVLNCIRTIHLFASAYPSVLSGSHASTLLPYLKNPSTPEQQVTTDYLLKIFRISIPRLPKTTSKLGQELQAALQPMIIKPTAGLQVLQECIACMCTVVHHLTRDFVRIVALLKSCNNRLQNAIKGPTLQQQDSKGLKALSILIFIGSILEHIYNSLLSLHQKYADPDLRGRILQCLGFLFRAQPTLMTEERSASIMDEIFQSGSEETQGRLLKLLQEFLVSEAAKHSSKEKETAVKRNTKASDVNMDELIGNTDGFADSGVSSAVVQRYLNHILQSALSQQPQIQAAAIDILSFTIKQGLAHPLQSFPVIIALETCPSTPLSHRANALHSILHTKHNSLLNTRYVNSAQAAFDYQSKITSGAVKGFRIQSSMPFALLQQWYSLAREKRSGRLDFLKSLSKVFQDHSSTSATQYDVDFVRFMAENFASFDYKTQEEVFIVVKTLTTVLSTNGTQVLELVSPSHLLSHMKQPVSEVNEAAMNVDSAEGHPTVEPVQDRIPLMRSTVIIGMVMLLKTHLKTLYSLSEEKCNKFVLGKKSAIGDKASVRRHQKAISWDRLPFATRPILTSSDADEQKTTFLNIWNEDGLTAEPEDDTVEFI